MIAQNLIDFDREWSTLMATRPEEMEDATQLETFYVKTAEFPAGFMTQYAPSMLVAQARHQEVATGFPVGKRFKSNLVTRVCDANPIHLGHHATADGRWRIYIFADTPAAGELSKTTDLAEWLLASPSSPLLACTPEVADIDAWFDVKVIYQQDHTSVDLGKVPAVFLPKVGPFQLTDYEKVYAADPADDIFAARGVSRAGAVVVVRPDQYVANVLPLDATDDLATFFDGIFLRRPSTDRVDRRPGRVAEPRSEGQSAPARSSIVGVAAR